MKQQLCCLAIKVSAATTSSLFWGLTYSSPRWRAPKDVLCCQSYPAVLLTYSSIIHRCVSTEHNESCRHAQLQSVWEPQLCMGHAIGYGLGAHWSDGMGQTRHTGAAWCAQCHLHTFPSPCGPLVARDGFIRGQLMVRDFGGKDMNRWVSAWLLPFLPTTSLPAFWS